MRDASSLPRRILGAAVGAATALRLAGGTWEPRHITGKLQIWGRPRKFEKVLERAATRRVQSNVQSNVQCLAHRSGLMPGSGSVEAVKADR